MNPTDSNKFKESKEFSERNNPEEQDEDAGEKFSKNDKYGAISASVFTIQGEFYIENKHVVISVKTDNNENSTCKTVYKANAKNYFKESKKLTDEFLKMCKINPNEPQNITN